MSAVAAPAPAKVRNRERSLALAFLAPSLAFLIVAFVVPLVLLLGVSVAGPNGPSLAAYAKLLGSDYYLGVIWNSLRLALLTTLFDFLIAYPAAFALARARGAMRTLLLSSLFLPLAASVIVKAFAWTILLRSDGVVNRILLGLGLIHAPIRMIFTETALVVGSVNIFLPF